MTELTLPAAALPTLPVRGSAARFPVRRIFCVGRNYAAHAAEMGAEVDREAPFYFTKAPFAVTGSGATVPFAAGTADLHHEVELVVALGAGGAQVAPAEALALVWGFGVGLDMTRRDLQAVAKSRGRPWSLAKDFDDSAIIGPLTPAAEFALADQRIALDVNGAPRQDGRLSDMVWSVPELIADLSRFYRLKAGDLIMTGTPAGVGAVGPGDVIEGRIDGLDPVRLAIA